MKVVAVSDIQALEKALLPFWVDKDRADGISVKKDCWSFALQAEDGVVVGGAVGHIKWGWSHLENLMVSPEHRGQDGATLLMEQVERHARMNGALGLHVMTYSAENFYRKVGFVEFGRLDNFPPGKSMVMLCKKF